MKIKLSDLFAAQTALNKLVTNQEKDEYDKLPTRTSYKLYMLINEIEPSLKFFEKQRYDLFEKYGEHQGNQIVVPFEKRPALNEEIEKIGEIECDKELEKIDVSLDLNLGISPTDIARLVPLINFID